MENVSSTDLSQTKFSKNVEIAGGRSPEALNQQGSAEIRDGSEEIQAGLGSVKDGFVHKTKSHAPAVRSRLDTLKAGAQGTKDRFVNGATSLGRTSVDTAKAIPGATLRAAVSLPERLSDEGRSHTFGSPKVFATGFALTGAAWVGANFFNVGTNAIFAGASFSGIMFGLAGFCLLATAAHVVYRLLSLPPLPTADVAEKSVAARQGQLDRSKQKLAECTTAKDEATTKFGDAKTKSEDAAKALTDAPVDNNASEKAAAKAAAKELKAQTKAVAKAEAALTAAQAAVSKDSATLDLAIARKKQAEAAQEEQKRFVTKVKADAATARESLATAASKVTSANAAVANANELQKQASDKQAEAAKEHSQASKALKAAQAAELKAKKVQHALDLTGAGMTPAAAPTEGKVSNEDVELEAANV